jgi:hypothetical protein
MDFGVRTRRAAGLLVSGFDIRALIFYPKVRPLLDEQSRCRRQPIAG